MGGHPHQEPSPKIDPRSWTRLGLCRTASPFSFLKTSPAITDQRSAKTRSHGMDATRQTTAVLADMPKSIGSSYR